jgi:hypothetical protein
MCHCRATRRPRASAMKATLMPGLKHRFSYERFVVAWDRFDARVADKVVKAGVA